MYEWEITSISSSRVVWRGVTFHTDGSNPATDTVYWRLVRRKNEKKFYKRSGFSAFIRRIEEKTDDK